MPQNQPKKTPVFALFSFLHGRVIALPLSFFWGASLLPRLSAQMNFPLFLALAAAGFFIGTYAAEKCRRIREYSVVLFMLVFFLGFLLPFRYELMMQFLVFGFWSRSREGSFPPPYLAPTFLAGGLVTLFFHGEEYHFCLTLLALLFAEMLFSPASRFKWKMFRLALICFLYLLTQQDFFPRQEDNISAGQTDALRPSSKTLFIALGSVSGKTLNILVLPEKSLIFHFFKTAGFRFILSNSIPGSGLDDQYDLIIADASLTKTNALAEFISHRLAPEGRVLLPKKECSILPDFYWVNMPDEDAPCRYLLGGKRPFYLTPEEIEENMMAMADETKWQDFMIPGEIAGALVDYHPQQVQVEPQQPPVRLPALAWAIPGLWVFLEILSFLRRKITDHLLIAESSFAFAAVTALLLENFPYENYFHGMELLLPGIALIWLFCRPALRPRVEILLTIAGIIGSLIWSIGNSAAWSIAALLAGGFAFSGEMRRKQNSALPASRFSLIAGLVLGFLAAWAIPLFTDVPVRQALWAALTLKIWTVLRN